MQRAVLHQDLGHVAAPLVQGGLDDGARRVGLRIGLQVEHLRLNQHLLKQQVDVGALLGGNVLALHLAAPLLHEDVHVGQRSTDLLRIGTRLVYLVDGENHGDTGGLRMVDGLNGLRHDLVIGCNHNDDDVGDAGTPRTHGGEGLMTGGVEEGDGLVAHLHLIGTDMLRDAARLALDDIGVADVVQQGGLAVVHMTHHGDDGRARHQVLLAVLRLLLFLLQSDKLDGEAVVLGQQRNGLRRKPLVDGHRQPQAHADGNDVGDRLVHHDGQFVGGDELRHLQHALLLFVPLHLLHHLLLDVLAFLLAVLRGLALLYRGHARIGLANLLHNVLFGEIHLVFALLLLGLGFGGTLLLPERGGALLIAGIGGGFDALALFLATLRIGCRRSVRLVALRLGGIQVDVGNHLGAGQLPVFRPDEVVGLFGGFRSGRLHGFRLFLHLWLLLCLLLFLRLLFFLLPLLLLHFPFLPALLLALRFRTGLLHLVQIDETDGLHRRTGMVRHKGDDLLLLLARRFWGCRLLRRFRLRRGGWFLRHGRLLRFGRRFLYRRFRPDRFRCGRHRLHRCHRFRRLHRLHRFGCRCGCALRLRLFFRHHLFRLRFRRGRFLHRRLAPLRFLITQVNLGDHFGLLGFNRNEPGPRLLGERLAQPGVLDEDLTAGNGLQFPLLLFEDSKGILPGSIGFAGAEIYFGRFLLDGLFLLVFSHQQCIMLLRQFGVGLILDLKTLL